mgnify:CR=1 FL=1
MTGWPTIEEAAFHGPAGEFVPEGHHVTTYFHDASALGLGDRCQVPGQGAQQSGLATAIGTDQSSDLTRGNHQVEMVKNGQVVLG